MVSVTDKPAEQTSDSLKEGWKYPYTKIKCSLWNMPPKTLDHLNLPASVIQQLEGSKTVHNKVLYSGNHMTPSVIQAHVWHRLKVKSIVKSNISKLNLSF